MKQLHLLPGPLPYFGGALDISPKRSIRPLSTKNPTHLVLKAQKNFNLYKNKSAIERIIHRQAKAFGIKIYGFSIQRDHIHFNIRIFSRDMYKRFIRAVTGLIARRLKAHKLSTYKVWRVRPFTRIVTWGKAFQTLKKYILQNELEIQGLIPKQPRKHMKELAISFTPLNKLRN